MVDTVWSADKLVGEWALTEAGDLQSLNPLYTAVILLLFTDKPLPIPESAESKQRATWHGNSFDTEGEGQLGSYLWTLDRDVPNEVLRLKARNMVSDALRPLIDQRAVAGFYVDVEIHSVSFDNYDRVLAIMVSLIGKDEQQFVFQYPII